MHMCTVCGNDATTTLYVESDVYAGDVYTMYVCSVSCESWLLSTEGAE